MKRRLVFLLLLLVGGAIVNFAVAWGCASFVPIRLTETTSAFTDYEEQWRSLPWAGRFPESLKKSCFAYAGVAAGRCAQIVSFQFYTVHRPPDNAPLGTISLQTDIVELGSISAGWPLIAMRGDIWVIAQIRHADRRDLIGKVLLNGLVRGIRQPEDDFDYSFSDMDLIPFRPIWPGFAINTVFYAFVLWLLFAGPFVLRRLRGGRRIRRGLCPKCAYDLRGTEANICPECGATR